MSDENLIGVWTVNAAVSARTALPLPTMAVVSIPAETLSNNLRTFLITMDAALESHDLPKSGFEVESLILNLAVNAQGGLELIGKLSASATASITVTLKKRNPK